MTSTSMSQPTAGDRTKSDPSHKPTILINESSDLALCAGGRNPGERSVPSSPTRSRPRSRSLQPDHGETAPNHPTLTAPRSPPRRHRPPDADVTPVPLPPSPASPARKAPPNRLASHRPADHWYRVLRTPALAAALGRTRSCAPARTGPYQRTPFVAEALARCVPAEGECDRPRESRFPPGDACESASRELPLIGMFALPSTERGWSITRLAAATPTRLRGISPRT